MDNLLLHPTRVILASAGILFALGACAFFDAPAMLLPAISLVLRFILSGRKTLVVSGYIFLVLGVAVFSSDMPEIERGFLRKFFVYGAALLIILAYIHLPFSKGEDDSGVS